MEELILLGGKLVVMIFQIIVEASKDGNSEEATTKAKAKLRAALAEAALSDSSESDFDAAHRAGLERLKALKP